MSTRVVKHCVCDRCGELGDAPVVTGMPAGWASVVSTFSYHLCPACLERALAVNEPPTKPRTRGAKRTTGERRSE